HCALFVSSLASWLLIVNALEIGYHYFVLVAHHHYFVVDALVNWALPCQPSSILLLEIPF
ncbi:23942_t:CDS:1, partial [Gigaspora margarita]